MSIPRPKLLSVITIPTGGWVFTVYVKSSSKAGAFDTTIEVTLAAGDYFMAWDNQNDDFLHELHSKLYAELVASGPAHHSPANRTGKPFFSVDSDHKVRIDVENDEHMRFAWNEDDGASVAGVLGFDASAADDFTGTQLTADYQHAYAWYAKESATDEGWLRDSNASDVPEVHAIQSTAPSGHSKTHYIGLTHTNRIILEKVPAEYIWSNKVSYTSAPNDPWVRNQGLECWFREAAQGKRFRFYRDSTIDETRAEVSGSGTGSAVTTLTDTARAFTTDPQEHAGKILQMVDFGDSLDPMRWYITSHTATVITVPNDVHNTSLGYASTVYRIFDQRYATYILDLNEMRTFDPEELPKIDRYNITIPVRLYV